MGSFPRGIASFPLASHRERRHSHLPLAGRPPLPVDFMWESQRSRSHDHNWSRDMAGVQIHPRLFSRGKKVGTKVVGIHPNLVIYAHLVMWGVLLTHTPPLVFSWEGGKVGIHIWSCGGLSAHTHPPLFSRGKVGRWESTYGNFRTFGHVGCFPLTRTPPPFFSWEGGKVGIHIWSF